MVMVLPSAAAASESISPGNLALIHDPLVMASTAPVAMAIELMSKTRREGADAAGASSAYDSGAGLEPYLPAATYRAIRASCVVVVDDQRVIGLLSEADVVDCIAQRRPLNLALGEVVAPLQAAVEASALNQVAAAIALLQKTGDLHLPVLDSQRQLVGLLTQESLCYALTLAERHQPADLAAAATVREGHRQAVLAAIPDLIMRVGADGVYREVVSYRDLCLFPEDYNVIGRNVAEVLPPNLVERQLFYLQAALDTGEVQIFEQTVQQNGQPQVEEVRVVKCGADEVLYIIRDITEHAQAVAALRQSERTNRIMIATIPDLLIQMDLAGRYRQMSGGAAVCVKYPSAEAPELDVHNILPPDMVETRLHAARRAVETGHLQIYEQSLEVEGRQFYEDVRIAPVDAENVLVIIRDISDRKQAEFALNQLIEATAATGQNFFPALVRYITEALQVSHAVISQKQGDQLRVIAIWADSALQPTFTYLIEQTPCELTVKNGGFYCDHSVQAQFPGDRLLVEIGVDSYLGTAMRDSQGQVIGTLYVLNYRPIPEPTRAQDLLRVFAARATAELERQQVMTLLEQLNHELEAKVTARTQTLQQVNSLQRAILDCADYAIIATDPAGLIQSFNAGAERMLGYSAAEIVGQSTLDTVHNPERVDQNTGSRSELASGFRQFSAQARLGTLNEKEWSYVCKNGTRLPVSLSFTTLKDDSQQILGFLSIAKDITDRKAAEQKIQASEEKFRNLVENANDIIYTLSPDGVFTYVSPNWTEILGHPIEAVINQPFSTFVHPEDLPRCVEFLQRIIEKGIKQRGIEYRVRHSNGEWHWHTSSGSPQLDADGHLAYAGIAHDITDRKQFEAELNRINTALMRATCLKDEFLANMSHELRTPLNAILGMTEALQEGVFGQVNPHQYSTLQAIERSSHHLLALINDVLDVAKMNAGQVQLDCQAVDVGLLCESSLMFVRQQALKKQISIQLQVPCLPPLWADERRMRQVLINLLDNAIKFTPPQGSVTLKASLQADGAAPRLGIAVMDTGIGIAPEHIGQLFQAFVQVDSAFNRKYEGTGLGLSLVKQIVTLHGGEVAVTSQVGTGSCFILDLPCIAEITARESVALPPQLDLELEPAEPEMAPLILLAEDNEANVLTISSYLEAKGFRVNIARNGLEAIAHAQSAPPDLILMDVQMPGIDGIEAMGQMRRIPALTDIPIIALTALAMAGDRDRCLAAGATEYFSKPVMLQQLTATIRQLLSQC